MELKTDQKEFLTKLKNAVLVYDQNAQVILFGSRARGDFKKDSDWDILIITEKKADYLFQRKIRDDIYEIQLAYSEPVSTIIMDEYKWGERQITPLYKNVVREGKPV